jgi:hypothetical protein
VIRPLQWRPCRLPIPTWNTRNSLGCINYSPPQIDSPIHVDEFCHGIKDCYCLTLIFYCHQRRPRYLSVGRTINLNPET